MNIVALKNETFDNFLLKSHEINKLLIKKAVESYDKEIYCSIDKKRFNLIRLDEITILSTYGIINFKRRYYFYTYLNQYCYLLDNKLDIPKSKRMTNELIIKILRLSSTMAYKEVGENLSNEFTLSKSTIYKVIPDVYIDTFFETNIHRKKQKVHVQIDEKYIGITNSTNKKKYKIDFIVAIIKGTVFPFMTERKKHVLSFKLNCKNDRQIANQLYLIEKKIGFDNF